MLIEQSVTLKGVLPKVTYNTEDTKNKNIQPVLNGKYRLINRLGEGNTSKVYLA